MAINANPGVDQQSVRRQTMTKEKKKLVTIPQISPGDIAVYANKDYLFLDDFLNLYDPKQARPPAPLSGLLLTVYHDIVFTLVFHLPVPAEYKEVFQKSFVTDAVKLVSAVFRVPDAQKNPVLTVSEQEEPARYYETVMDDKFKVQLAGLASHPYYSKAAFENESSYSDWMESEKARLSQLIKQEEVVVTKTKPGFKERLLGDKKGKAEPAAAQKPTEERPLDHFAIYAFLVKLCLMQVNEMTPLDTIYDEMDDDEQKDVVLEAVYPVFGWLLDEYATRCGIGRTFQLTTLLVLLCPTWESCYRNLLLTTNTFDALDSVLRGRSKHPKLLITKEKAYRTEALGFVRSGMEVWMSRFRLLEPSPSRIASIFGFLDKLSKGYLFLFPPPLTFVHFSASLSL